MIPVLQGIGQPRLPERRNHVAPACVRNAWTPPTFSKHPQSWRWPASYPLRRRRRAMPEHLPAEVRVQPVQVTVNGISSQIVNLPITDW